MRVLSIVIILAAIGLLSGCGPTFNWRDVTIGATPLIALFPCKPDDTERSVPLAGQGQPMTMRSCSAGGTTFAIGHARLSDPALAATALAQWRGATVAGLGPQPTEVSLQPPPGSPALPQLLSLRASRDATKEPVQHLQGLWFAHGPDVFAALVFAPTLVRDVAEPFFAGLRLR
jgi:hypothetical protein